MTKYRILYPSCLLFLVCTAIVALSAGKYPMTLATLIVSAATAPCGTIGWVGLLIPHMARIFTGAEHDRLIPLSALLGAVFMLLVDTLARMLPGGELPVGILTAIIGAPCFGLLLIRNKTTIWNNH